MCCILITAGDVDHEKLVQSPYFTNRGLPGHVSHADYGTFNVSHSRLPLQKSSKVQPVEHGDFPREDLFLVGEYYETMRDELPELRERLEKQEWLCDWEGDLFVFERGFSNFRVFIDPLRKRPLYFMRTSDKFVMTNSLGLFLDNKEELGIDLDLHYLNLVKRQKIPCDGTLTPFRQVKCLIPGEHNFLTSTNETYVGYGSLPYEYAPKKKVEKPDLMEIIRRRVSNECLTKDYGVLLSGGLDSSLILHAVSTFRPMDRVKCFVANEQLCEQEAENVSWIKENYNVEIQNINLWATPSMETKFIETGSPVDLGSVGPQIGLAKCMRDAGLNVAISGDGADEFFGGYKRNLFSDYRWHDIFTELINYHHPRLDQIMMNSTIELRNPLSALPLLNYVMSLPASERMNKHWLRREAVKMGLIPQIAMSKKVPLKTTDIKEDALYVREQTVDRFIAIYGGSNDREQGILV